MLRLTKEESRRLVRTSGVICGIMIGLVLLCDTVGKSLIVIIPATLAAPMGGIVSGMMYVLSKRPIEYIATLAITSSAGLGAGIGALITSLI
jgi:hypothetical protein